MSRVMLARKAEAVPAAPLRTAVKNSAGELRIGEPADAFEHEADRVADAIMAGNKSGPRWSLSRMSIEAPLQRRATGAPQSSEAPPVVHDVLRSPGEPLDAPTRAFMEPRFEHDFSHVRVHADGKAAESAAALAAQAYTFADRIVFNSGRYAPSSARGRKLLAHELAHVVQQSRRGRALSAVTSGALERDAERAATAVTQGSQPAQVSEASGAGIARRIDPEEERRSREQQERLIGIVRHGETKGERRLYEQQERLTGSTLPMELMSPYSLAQELHELIKEATWPEIRKRVYPKESAAGIQSAKQRKSGASTDLMGLGSIKSLEKFAVAMHEIQRNWGKTADERLKAVGNAADVQLTDAEVPKFKAFHKEKMTEKAYFDQPKWGFVVNEELVNQTSLNDADAGDLANTTLHESRHAEQAFLAARYAASATNKQDAGTIAKNLQIPREIAKEAVGKKFSAATDPAVAALGTQMYDANVPHGKSNQAISDAVTASIARLDAVRGHAETAVKALDKSETPKTTADARFWRDALRSQIAAVEQSYHEYRNIPYEADAHKVGDAEEQAFKGWP